MKKITMAILYLATIALIVTLTIFVIVNDHEKEKKRSNYFFIPDDGKILPLIYVADDWIYINCQTIENITVEIQREDGTEEYHWKDFCNKIVGVEYIDGTITKPKIFSKKVK